MDLHLKDQLFVVCGATSGFGKAIAQGLIHEGAEIIIIARKEDPLIEMVSQNPKRVSHLAGDITTDATISALIRKIGNRKLSGIVVNAGGPPAMSFMDSEVTDWDTAYETILRWKVKVTKEILELMIPHRYGRIVYIESVSVKQPVENLVLSNSLRLAVVGFVKTLASEIAKDGITVNVLAPGYHATPAMERLYESKATLLGILPEQAKAEFEKESAIGKLGDPDDFAGLALWLLSEQSRFVTGQTISVDGGLNKGIV